MSYDEWYEAISSGDPIKKRNLMYKRMDKMRASSKLSPEQTEGILAIYERASRNNFEIGERNCKEYRVKYLPSGILDWLIFILAIAFVILAYIASR